jgi:hypothetical protein
MAAQTKHTRTLRFITISGEAARAHTGGERKHHRNAIAHSSPRQASVKGLEQHQQSADENHYHRLLLRRVRLIQRQARSREEPILQPSQAGA